MFKKVSKRVLNMFWGKIFEKNYAQCSMEGRVFENFQNFFFKIPKMPKSVPKSIQTCFRVIFSKKKFMPGVPWRVEFSKIFNFFFKIPKMPKIVPKSIQACFERFLGQIFRKFFCPVFRGGSSFRKFSKKNIFKIPKLPKSVPKSIQT